MTVRAVLFDAGHTLLAVDYAGMAAFLRSRGHDVGEAAVATAERRARVRLEEEHAAAGARARKGEGRYLRYLLAGLGVDDPDEHRAFTEWRRAYNQPVGLCCHPDPEAAVALAGLRAAGLAVGVVSNSNGSARLALERAGLARHLDFVIDSTVVGLSKPDPRVFRLALEQAGAGAAEAVYVGDSYFVDVVGARQAGLGAVLFDPEGTWGARDCPVAPGLCAAAALARG
jgi:putative hydrolase of the HAD superfamily